MGTHLGKTAAPVAINCRGEMPQSLAHIALNVRDYGEVIAWFIEKLGFTLVADERVGPEQAAASPGRAWEQPGDIHTSSGPTRQPEQEKRWVAPPRFTYHWSMICTLHLCPG